MPLPECTDLPPLALAIVVLEETLVVGHTVLTEHEAKRSQSVSITCSNMAGWQGPQPHQSQLDPEDRGRKFDGRTLKIGFVRGGFMERFEGEDVPSHAGASSTEHFRGWKRRRSGDVRYDVGKMGM